MAEPARAARRRRMLVAALAGAVAAGGHAPLAIPWLTLLGLSGVLAVHLRAGGVRQAALLGWAGGVGYFAVALFWIVEPFLVDVARHGWMAPFALAGMAGGMALFWSAAAALAAWLVPGRRAAAALAWALAMAAAGAARSYLFTGFPWALPGHVWVGWPAMQMAALVGPLGLTLWTLLIPGLGLGLWLAGGGWRAAAVAVSAALLAGPHALGAWMVAADAARAGAAPGGVPGGVPGAAAVSEAPVLRLVQPNAAQHLKWDPAYARLFWERQLSFTAAPTANGRRPDMVIWPETAVPGVLERAASDVEEIAAAAQGAPVIFGIQRYAEGRAYNALVMLDAAGAVAAVYDKHHLVPFGEYLPFEGLMTRLGLSAFTAQAGFGYSSGPGPALIEAGGRLGRILPLICYEAIFPQDLRAAPGRADWIVQITNDAWFGRLAGPWQHLAQARLRAVEMGLPLVRVANTGISAVIDATGAVRASLGLGEAGYLDVPLPPARPPTPYARTGDAPVVALVLAALAALGLAARRKTG